MPTSAGKNRIVLVLGRKGSGKSTALAHLVADRRKERKVPVIALDFLGDLETIFDVAEIDHMEDLRAWFDKEETDCVVYDPDKTDKELMAAFAVQMGFAGNEHEPIEDVILCIDELDFPATTNALTADLAVRRIISYGRHYHIDLYCAARRPQDIPKALLSQSDQIVCGQLTTDRERANMEQYGFKGDVLEGLQVGEFVVFENGETSKTSFAKLW